MKNEDFLFYSNTKAIAFDLFNTLVYIGEPLNPYKWLFDALAISGQEKKHFKNLVLTLNTDNITSIFPSKYHKKLSYLISDFEQKVDIEVNSAVLFSNTMPTLNILSKKIPLYLVSNLATPYKEVVYDLGISKYFAGIFFSCDIKIAKPDQKIFSLIKEASTLHESEILMVGDSYFSDFLGSQDAGFKSVLINREDSKTYKSITSILSLNSLVKLFT